MKVKEFDDKPEMSSKAQFVPAELLARPWLVHVLLGLGLTSNHGYGYDLHSSPAPRRTCPSPSSGLLMQYAG
jgi:hypothetical protein